jgi:hypothetical protein
MHILILFSIYMHANLYVRPKEIAPLPSHDRTTDSNSFPRRYTHFSK